MKASIASLVDNWLRFLPSLIKVPSVPVDSKSDFATCFRHVDGVGLMAHRMEYVGFGDVSCHLSRRE